MWVKQEVNDTIKASDDNDDLYRGISPCYYFFLLESPADAGIPARRKNDEKNSSISKL